MTTATAAAPAKTRKLYNLVGEVKNLQQMQLTNQPGKWIRFDLDRSARSKGIQICVAFTKHADAFLSQFGNGAQVDVFGEFETVTYQKKQEDGSKKEVTEQRFRILGASVPGTRKQKTAEKAPETAETAAPAPVSEVKTEVETRLPVAAAPTDDNPFAALC